MMKFKLALLFVISLINYALIAQTTLTVNDTRNLNDAPNTYSHLVRFDFKDRGVIKSPGVGLFGSTLTIAQWGPDGTGNKNHQLHFNDGGVFFRSGMSNSVSWDSWRTVMLGDANGFLGIGIAAPKSLLHVYHGKSSASYSSHVRSVIESNEHAQMDILSGPNQESAIYLKATNNSGANTFGGVAYYTEGTAQYGLAFYSGNSIKMRLLDNGNLLIGKLTQLNSNYKIDVDGTIRANEIIVNTTGADFVFEPTYKLRTLSELEIFIKANKHLPDIAPAKEMQENGVSAGEMQTKLLQKVEELTLYVIEKDKQLEEQMKINSEQQTMLLEMKKEIEILKKKNNL